jgi:hypothetical protein
LCIFLPHLSRFLVKKPPAQIDLPSAEELLDEDVFYDAKEQGLEI